MKVILKLFWAFDEQYCNVGTYDVADMFEDAIREIGSEIGTEIGTEIENDEDERNMNLRDRLGTLHVHVYI